VNTIAISYEPVDGVDVRVARNDRDRDETLIHFFWEDATIGFNGSGRQGSTVARLAVAAGYDVPLSNSRGPQTLDDLVGAGPLGAGGRRFQFGTRAFVVPCGGVERHPGRCGGNTCCIC
jgi:hypothetical protein